MCTHTLIITTSGRCGHNVLPDCCQAVCAHCVPIKYPDSESGIPTGDIHSAVVETSSIHAVLTTLQTIGPLSKHVALFEPHFAQFCVS
jgi:hypothetical protein